MAAHQFFDSAQAPGSKEGQGTALHRVLSRDKRAQQLRHQPGTPAAGHHRNDAHLESGTGDRRGKTDTADTLRTVHPAFGPETWKAKNTAGSRITPTTAAVMPVAAR